MEGGYRETEMDLTEKDAFETFTHKMQFKRAAQLYTTVVTHYNIRIWPA